MERIDIGLPPELRARLAHKGQLLYEKCCGTDGRGICAESFALFHIWRGEPEVAEDLLTFLHARLAALQIADPENRLELTQELAKRVRAALLTEGNNPPDPAQWAAILKAKKEPVHDEV